MRWETCLQSLRRSSVELTTAAEADSAYDCLLKEMTTAYGKSKNPIAKNYTDFRRYREVAYQSATHDNRFVQNYGNDYAKNYAAYENAGTFKLGAFFAKDSFTVSGDGKMAVGPLFLLQNVPSGFNKASLDWKYSMIMPDGKVFGATGGKNSAAMNFCYECHNGVAPDQGAVMLLPEESRVKKKLRKVTFKLGGYPCDARPFSVICKDGHSE